MSANGTGAVAFEDVCICPHCSHDLAREDDGLRCKQCHTWYRIEDGVLVLLPDYDDSRRQRFVEAYNQIARDDLAQAFEYDRSSRHDALLRFIGDARGKRILDIGSSDAQYLRRLPGRQKVALDIALPFLTAVCDEAGILRVCADAETLPFKPRSFDIVIISDVLEHVLDPERLVQKLRLVCHEETRVIVHVPWREDIAKYEDSPYEFTHLRNFNDYTFAMLWRDFSLVRERSTHPSLEEPFVFQLRRLLPLPIYDRLVDRYFNRGFAATEFRWRARWIEELPRRERLLLLLYPAKFKIFELRPRAPSERPDLVTRARTLVGLERREAP